MMPGICNNLWVEDIFDIIDAEDEVELVLKARERDGRVIVNTE
jgi:hypothetical protein